MSTWAPLLMRWLTGETHKELKAQRLQLCAAHSQLAQFYFLATLVSPFLSPLAEACLLAEPLLLLADAVFVPLAFLPPLAAALRLATASGDKSK